MATNSPDNNPPDPTSAKLRPGERVSRHEGEGGESVRPVLPSDTVRDCGPLEVAPSDNGEVVAIRGEVDASTAPQLRTRLKEVVGPDPKRVVLDVRDAAFKDWTGLGVLLGGRNRVRGAGGDLVLRSPNTGTHRILEAGGMKRLFPIEQDPERKRD